MPELEGVCDLTDPVQYDHWMVRVAPEDIWGVGVASARRLEALGCESVADVRDFDPRIARKALTVVGERLVHELRGTACLDLETMAPTRKGCAVTRSFSERVEDRATMEQAMATHASRLGEKLRREELATNHVTVFFHTSEHDRDRGERLLYAYPCESGSWPADHFPAKHELPCAARLGRMRNVRFQLDGQLPILAHSGDEE